jgi:hypothetical protein
MTTNPTISVKHFREAYGRVKWLESRSSDGKYAIWVNPVDEDIWTRLPLDEKAPDYRMYQDKNILMLLYALGIPENDSTAQDLISQLKSYNYKLISRLVASSDKATNTVPYELATVVPERNIDAFRYFYHVKKKERRSLPIEKFELNHTEVGSFVIPISILVDDTPNATLIPVQSDTNLILHEYLNAIDTLTKIPRISPTRYAEEVISQDIDSKLVKDFFGRDTSIARSREKYRDRISTISIGSKGSALLDYGLSTEEKNFQEVDLSSIEILKEDYIETLEKREIAADDTKIDERQVVLDVVVESIDRGGKVRLTVVSINHEKLKSPFKADSTELPKAKLDIFAEYFKNEGTATVTGDVFKLKGKLGKVMIDTLGEQSSKGVNTRLL